MKMRRFQAESLKPGRVRGLLSDSCASSILAHKLVNVQLYIYE